MIDVNELRSSLAVLAGDAPTVEPAYEGVIRRARRARRRRIGVGAIAVVAVVLISIVGFQTIGDDHAAQRIATKPAVTDTTATPVVIPPLARAALDTWKAFPVDTTPRPLIVFYDVNAPARGFGSDETKLAWESAQFTIAAGLANGPATAGGFPLITAQGAIARMRAEASPGPTANTPLTITAITLGTARFLTDRDMQLLPAWIVTFRGVTDPAQVLAVAPSSIFTPPTSPPSQGPPGLETGPVTLVGDHTIQVGVEGDPPGNGPCEANYEVHAYESNSAVALIAREIPKPTPTSVSAVCTTPGYVQRVTTTLAAPLGARVVVDALTRNPVLVTSSLKR